MDIYNQQYQYNISRNLQKRASYQNIFEIQNIIQNFNNQFNFGLSKKNKSSEPYANRNINIYNLNKNLNKILSNANKHFSKGQANKVYSFRRKKISSSYFDKIKNLYILKEPNLLSQRIIPKDRNNKNKKANTSIIIKRNKNEINKNYILPKIANDRKNIISNILSKKLNLIHLENSKSYSLIGKNENEYNPNALNNRLKLPRIKSTIVKDNKNINYNRILNRNKKRIRCNSSIIKTNIGVKSIYMSFGLTPQKKPSFNFNNKIILLKNKYKRHIKNEENKINNYDNISTNKLMDEQVINEIGKEYKFNQDFKKVDINKINHENVNDNMLLNDKGTLIGPFFN
jgi:hypothetical protein